MNEANALAAAELGARLQRELSACSDFRGRQPQSTERLVRELFSARRRFGITRIGSLTRLDRAGVAVSQAVRPLSLSNAVSQGKGETVIEASASALMEALEDWAAERIAPERIRVASALDLGSEIRNLYADCRVHGFDAGWDRLPLGWTDGYDLFTGRILPVPVAMVDTVYTKHSPHPVAFPRSTRGLAAGSTMLAAIIHAALEVLERASVAEAERHRLSPRELPIDPARVGGPLSSRILANLKAADLVAGIWLVPGDHGLPVFRCEVIETESHREIAPMSGEGFACDFTCDRALARALMEAAQARATALAGAREDITRSAYPERYDREDLDARRQAYLWPPKGGAPPAERDEPASGAAALESVLGALKSAGGQAALVVPLHTGKDPDFDVVRLVVPPLRDLTREFHRSGISKEVKTMTSDLVVFLGPTMRRAEAAGILDATYLPPAEQGSVVRAVRTYQPRAIVLIDGSFGNVPAVRHKEILWAMAKGVPVFGAASMGALRAAELAAFGMQGHGFIYRWYSLTPLADDDEVAVAMCPPEVGAAPLSEALINIRLTLGRATRAGIVTAEERRALEALARGTHFVERSYTRLLADAQSTMPDGSRFALRRLSDWLPSGALDQKREDAIGLLTRLARCPELLGKRPRTPPFQLTEAWVYDLDAAGIWDDDIRSILAEQGKVT